MAQSEQPGKTLPTYDPNWAARHEALAERLRTVGLSEAERERVTEAMHAAFHAQFRTAADYRQWVEDCATVTAQLEHKILPAAMAPDATVEQIRVWQAATYESLRRQDYPTLPVGQPPGVEFFATPIAEGARRASVDFAIPGADNTVKRLTIETHPDGRMGICIHDRTDDRLIAAPFFELMATKLKEGLFPEVEPTRLRFFLYRQPALGGFPFGEGFANIGMKVAPNDAYYDASWQHYNQVPEGIRAGDKQSGPAKAIESQRPDSRAPQPAGPRREA